MSIPNDISTYEKMANMKNIIGDSFVELLKQSIKNNQNENVIKMLDMTKEKPETFYELLPVAILSQNFEIVKYMVEKFKITEAETPNMNALSFVNSIYPDNSKNKLNEAKDNYLLVQSPFIIISGIGGNIEIYKYLLNNKLISDKKQVGFIGLSKKYKNLFYSNVVGACAYYGKHEILEFILKTPKNDLDINIPTTEKKSKNNSRVLVKEFTGLTPCMLAIVGPCSDLQTIDVLKKLINYNAKFDALDLNKDNLLHLATKNKKIETAKYLIDQLNLKNLLNETNKEGQTPLSLAQHLKDNDFTSYYNEKTGVDEKEIEENLKELINESNKSNKNYNKKKKNKKNKNNETITLLNTTEYQESLKVDTTSEKKNSSTYSNTYSKNTYNSSNNRDKLHALLDNPKPKKKKEKQEIKVEKEEKKVESNVEDKKEEEKKEDEKEEEPKEAEKDTKTKKIQNTEPDEDEEVIVGLSIKKHKKKNKGKKNKDNENEQNKEKELEEKRKKEEEEKRKKEEEEKEKQRKKEEEEEQKRIEEEKRKKQEEEEELKRIEEEKKQKEEEEKRKQEEEEKKRRDEEEERARKQKEEEEKRAKEEEERKKKLEEEQKKKEEEEKKKKEEEKKKKEEEKKKKEEEKKKKEEEKKKKEEEKKKKEEEKNEEEEEEEEDYSYSDEENFLDDGDNSEKEEKKEKPKIINQKDYETLNKNYFELERKILLLEKEKEELASCLKKLYLEKKANANIPITSNNEENINDLMFLVNKELENKDNIIHELEGKVSKVDLRNIENFSKDELLEYKEFYTKNLKIINEAMKQY